MATNQKKDQEIQQSKNTDKDVIQSMKVPFTPIDNKVLIKPMEPVYIRKEVTELDEDSNKSKKSGPKGDVMDTKTVEKDVKANVRRGVVLSIPKMDVNEKSRFPIDIGDTIVYWDKSSIPTFELYRDSILVNKYDILGIWDIEKQRDNDIYNRVYPESNNKEQTSSSGNK